MWLVHNGVPFDLAFDCDDDFFLAAIAATAGFQGLDFDWNTLTVRKRET